MAKISRAGIRAATKRVIAGFKRNWTAREIHVEHTLKGRRPTGLGFTEAGLNSLTRALNDEFEPYGVQMRVSEVRGGGNVRGLYTAIWKKVPSGRRE